MLAKLWQELEKPLVMEDVLKILKKKIFQSFVIQIIWMTSPTIDEWLNEFAAKMIRQNHKIIFR